MFYCILSMRCERYDRFYMFTLSILMIVHNYLAHFSVHYLLVGVGVMGGRYMLSLRTELRETSSSFHLWTVKLWRPNSILHLWLPVRGETPPMVRILPRAGYLTQSLRIKTRSTRTMPGKTRSKQTSLGRTKPGQTMSKRTQSRRTTFRRTHHLLAKHNLLLSQRKI